jgi:F-type H+-transporting ATPase subunit gamma
MKLIAAAKLKRYSSIIDEARVYSRYLTEMTERIINSDYSFQHPYLEDREEGDHVALLFVTSDKGLCGGYNANLIKKARDFFVERPDIAVSSITVGKKGHSVFQKLDREIVADFVDWTRMDIDELVSEVSGKLMELYDGGKINRAYIIYSKFVSAFVQKPVVDQLLPLTKFSVDEETKFSREFIYEPSEEEVFKFIIAEFLKNSIHISFLESLASEFGARMTAMDNATRNAEEMLYNLTLTYNKLRQATITKELIEIVSGSEALQS